MLADAPALPAGLADLLLAFDEMFRKGQQFYAMSAGPYWLAFHNGVAYWH